MKLNKLLAGLGAAVLTAALAVTASATDPLVVWDFSQADNTALYNADGTAAFSVNNGTATYDADNACLNLDVDGGDPFFVLPNQGTFPAENSFVRVKYNLTDLSDWSTSIYFTTDTVSWSETGHWKGIFDGDDGEWCEQTFIMTECAAWAGTITDMRLDIFDSAWAGQNAKVAYVAVFGSEADANAFDFAAWQAGGRNVTLAAPAAAETTAEAAPAEASGRKSAVEVAANGIFTYDESDGEYWSPALTMLDKSGLIMGLEDGTIIGYSDVSTYTDATGVKNMDSLASGWYEVVLCNLGTNAEWFPADVKGKVALCVRGDSTFTVKSENSMNAGAVACIIGNNCRAVELVDETGTMTGEYENVGMSVDYYTIPMCAVSSDVTVRLVAQTADIAIADAVVAVEDIYFGDLELSVEHKKTGYIFLGTLEEFAANPAPTDANTITKGGSIAGAAATEAPAEEAAADVVAIEAYDAYQEYPAVDPLANSGAGYATLEEAVASIGKTAISGYTFVSGTGSFANEGPENLWDNDTATKFCSNEFPTTSIVALDGEYTIDGIVMDTANDNASYNGRSPYEWAIYGSKDGAAWTAIAYGDDYFFEETDFTYYAGAVTAGDSYKYIMFQSEGGLSGTFQVSEVVVCGTKAEAAAPVVEEAPAVEEPVVEETPAEEPAAEEVAEAPAEEPAAEVVEEPVVVEEEVVEEAPVEEAAETFDFGVIAVVAAIVSAAGYAISKKR